MRDREDAAVNGLDLDAVVETLQEAPVTVGILYGSVARGRRHERSDVDLAVGFEEDLESSERTDARLALIERLSAVLSTDCVDVVPLSEAPAELITEIRRDGVLLYGSEAEFDRRVEPSDDLADRDEALASFDEVLADLERVV